MALIKCSECGKEISDKAAACVHCGCPVSVSDPKSSEPIDFQKTFGKIFNDSSRFVKERGITVDFNATVNDTENESTPHSIFIKELGRTIEFSVPNNIKVGQAIRKKLNDDSTYSFVRFNVVSVSKTSAVSNTKAVETIKSYRPNWFVQFLRSGRFYSAMIIFIGVVVAFLNQGNPYMAFVAVLGMAPFWLPLLIAYFKYPLYHLKKYIQKNGVEDAIRNDTGYMNVAISTYNALPGKKTLAYIKSLNVNAAQKIEQQLAAKKKK